MRLDPRQLAFAWDVAPGPARALDSPAMLDAPAAPSIGEQARRIVLEQRRQERQELIALLRTLVVRKPGNDMPTRDLARMLRLHLGRPPRLSVLGQAMAAMGYHYAKYERTRAWRGCALVVSPERARRHVVAAWEKRLAAEGLGLVKPIEPEWKGGSAKGHSRPAEKRAMLQARAEIYSGVLDKAKDYLWSNPWKSFHPRDREVWELWCLEGAYVREIERRTKIPKSTVQDIITRHKARAGILGA